MAPRILLIGLGNMGRGMVKNLAEKGNLDQPVLVYNRSLEKATQFVQSLPGGKVEAVSTLDEGIKKADIIFTIVSNDQAVESVYEQALQFDVKGKLFVESSTIAPETTEQVAKAVLAQGADYIASPVFGAPAAADAGMLIFVPAGTSAAIERLRPYTTGVMGRALIEFPDKPYSSSLKLKLIGNTFIMNMVSQVAEGLTLGEKAEIGTEPVEQFIGLLFGGVHSAYAKRMTTGDYYKREAPLFSVAGARKDIRHAQALAKSSGMELKNAETADGYLKQVEDLVGGEKGDIAGVYGAVRMGAGLKYEV